MDITQDFTEYKSKMTAKLNRSEILQVLSQLPLKNGSSLYVEIPPRATITIDIHKVSISTIGLEPKTIHD